MEAAQANDASCGLNDPRTRPTLYFVGTLPAANPRLSAYHSSQMACSDWWQDPLPWRRRLRRLNHSEGGNTVARSRVQRPSRRIVIAAVAAVGLSAALLGYPGHSRGAGSATQSSVKVAVVPGFKAPVYPGYGGVGTFPAANPRLSAFHFSQLAVSNLTAGNLAAYDTVILYGLRWSTISASEKAALNGFAATHKVMIWDSDGTGPQDYSTFVQPFSTLASNAAGKPQDSIVTFPKFANGFVNFLASNNPSSPYYLDPSQLVSDASMINDMNAMKTGTKNWGPALKAQNKNIPNGGWPLAWSYGVIGNHTGLAMYSGLDADAINNSQLNPNDEITELLLQLKAPFRTTPDTSCAPNCAPPPQPLPDQPMSCSFAKHVPTHWVHGRVSIGLKCSPAAGVTARVRIGPSGPVLASGTEQSGLIHLRVQTRLLPTNHISRPVVVYGTDQQTKSKYFRLKVDNTPPRLLQLKTSATPGGHLVRFRVSEKSRMRIEGGGPRYRHWVSIARQRLISATLSGSVRHVRLMVRDRAGNTVVRKLTW